MIIQPAVHHFAYDPDKVSLGRSSGSRLVKRFSGHPIGALNYIMGHENADWNDRGNGLYQILPRCRRRKSGARKVGLGVSEERNIYEDY